jgi:hypothetical protein
MSRHEVKVAHFSILATMCHLVITKNIKKTNEYSIIRKDIKNDEKLPGTDI